MDTKKPRFFRSGRELRAWLEANSAQQRELMVGFYKRNAKKTGITRAEAVDEALCFGWIDGVRKRLDDHSYVIRFTPRKPGSIWSARNLARVAELSTQGRMHPAGLAAFEGRDRAKEAVYAYENQDRELDPAYLRQFEANEAAWRYFRGEAPSYRKTAIHWVMSAKREATRQSRLATLIEDSERGERIKLLRRER
jgi:uncharacterized protein YdeI (YjbR/CyaY-like superfamily)